jgi:hypothetical protein
MPLRQVNYTNSVSTQLIKSLQNTISPERWHTYELAAGYDLNRAHALYLWNASVGQSFHYPLQSVEVCLRNAIHKAFSKVYGSDWCNEATCRAALQQRQGQEIEQAARRRFQMYRTAATTPQIVSSLTFGFWIAALNRQYNNIIWTDHKDIVFPNLPDAVLIRDVARTGAIIKNLRNRIFHQEPLIGRDLLSDYSAILKMVGWICEDTREWVRTNSSVPHIIRQRP